MDTKLYELWVDVAKRLISLSSASGFEEMIFDNSKLFDDALMNFMANGYLVV